MDKTACELIFVIGVFGTLIAAKLDDPGFAVFFAVIALFGLIESKDYEAKNE